MSAMSKPSIPSLTDIIKSMYPECQLSNMQQVTLIIFCVVFHPVQRSGNILAYSHKNKCQILVPNGVFNSNPLQKLNNRDKHEWIRNLFASIWNYFRVRRAEMVYIMIVLTAQNILGVLYSQKPAITGLVSRQVSPEIKFGMYPGQFNKSCKIRKTSDICLRQTPTETKRFSKSIEYFRVSPEISTRFLDQFNLQMPLQDSFLKNSEQGKLSKVTVPITAPNDLVLHIMDAYKRRAEMKCQGMCYLCQEKIKGKKFFRERRYGILSNCECMICYGCVRETVGEAGWTKESVICPVCSVESDTLASSHKWIEGQEKTDFFQTYNENMETVKNAIKYGPDMKGERMYSEQRVNNCMGYFFPQIFI